MPKEKFRDELRLSKKNKELLDRINSIIDEYAEDGYKLTLRQAYYQLVSRDIILNKKAEYAKLSSLIVKGRMFGIVDWDAIEDRLRIPYRPYWVEDIPSAIDDTIDQYRLDRQKRQDTYIEVWVEKDALSGILKRITSHYHVRLMVNRGYCSCTALHDAYERFEWREKRGDKTIILYFGDHDPSGLDMIRDIKARLNEFGAYPTIKHIGLTQEQIKKYDPPTNPAKITDPRAKWYIQKYGNVSWEVDALSPQVLHQIIKDNIEAVIDMDLFEKQILQEEKDKIELRRIADTMSEE